MIVEESTIEEEEEMRVVVTGRCLYRVRCRSLQLKQLHWASKDKQIDGGEAVMFQVPAGGAHHTHTTHTSRDSQELEPECGFERVIFHRGNLVVAKQPVRRDFIK